MRSIQALTVFALAALLASCGGSGSSTGPNNNPSNNNPPNNNPPAGNANLNVQNNYFAPSTATVTAGATVKWTWDSCSNDPYGGSVCVDHGIIFDDGATSPVQSAGTWNRNFATKGTFRYHCSVHGESMAGTVTVQ